MITEKYLGNLFQMPEINPSSINYLLSSGFIHTASSFNYIAKDLNCFLLLYTVKGHGTLKIDKHIFPLSASGSNFLLLDCRNHCFQLLSGSALWDFHVFYFTGNPLSDLFLYIQQPLQGVCLKQVHSCTPLFSCLEHLNAQASVGSKRSVFHISGLLYQLLSYCVADQFPEDVSASLPEYLTRIQTLFENHYEDLYTLDSLSEQVQISKYRLCREFHSCFGCSPIQYLNRVRIKEAKKLLEKTNYKVYEVGCLVGIDNTNHFISLFKKHTGFTPEQYRKKVSR